MHILRHVTEERMRPHFFCALHVAPLIQGEDQRARDEDEGQREEQGEERQIQERAKTTPGCEVGGEEGEGKESRVEMGEESNKRPAGPIESPQSRSGAAGAVLDDVNHRKHIYCARLLECLSF